MNEGLVEPDSTGEHLCGSELFEPGSRVFRRHPLDLEINGVVPKMKTSVRRALALGVVFWRPVATHNRYTCPQALPESVENPSRLSDVFP